MENFRDASKNFLKKMSVICKVIEWERYMLKKYAKNHKIERFRFLIFQPLIWISMLIYLCISFRKILCRKPFPLF